jgi:hypothetical protein
MTRHKGDLPDPFDAGFHHAMDHPNHDGNRRPSSARLLIHLIRQHHASETGDVLFGTWDAMDANHRPDHADEEAGSGG